MARDERSRITAPRLIIQPQIQVESRSSAQLRIFAVVVLYGMSPEQSPALSSLNALLKMRPVSGLSFAGLVYDNSPQPQVLPSEFSSDWTYRHDGTNPGLARPYQVALEQAQESGFDWLLLLDQDTVVTSQYLEQALVAIEALRQESTVAAIVPFLMQDGDILSPHWPKWHNPRAIRHAAGIQVEDLNIYNSASILRVAALHGIGGFPQEFPLDYLDHAVYHMLKQQGGRIYQLAAVLVHELGSKHSDTVMEFGLSMRLQSIAAAESRYYRQYGSFREVFRLTLQRLRMAARMLLAGQVTSALKILNITFPKR